MIRQLYLLFLVVMFGCMTRHQPEIQSPEKNTKIDHCAPVSKAAGTHVKNLEKLLHKGLYFKFDTYYLSCRERLPEKYRLYFDIFHCDLFGYPEFLEVQDQILLKKYYNELTESEKIDSMAFAVYNDSFKLRNIRIHTEYIHEDTVTYFGLLGQDILGHFNEITMNFIPNSIEYRNRD